MEDVALANQGGRRHAQGQKHQNQDPDRTLQIKRIGKEAGSQAEIDVSPEIRKVSERQGVICRNARTCGQKQQRRPG